MNLDEPTHTLVPCWMPKPCLQETSVRVSLPQPLSMPKFLAGGHYNEEETSRHLKQNIGYWPVQINGNKFASSQILKKNW